MSLKNIIKNEERISFATNYKPDNSGSLFDQLFPSRKTDNMRIALLQRQDSTPVIAMVHSFDSETRIKSREPLSEIKVDKLLVKVKINLTEKYAMLEEELSAYPETAKGAIFNDMLSTSNDVAARIRAMKAELLSTGKITVKENGVDMTIDFGVPANNISSVSWASAPDIIGDFQTVFDKAASAGYSPTRAVVSRKLFNKILSDEKVKTAILGETGKMLTVAEFETWFAQQFGVVFAINDDVYRVEKANGGYETKRYFNENTIAFFGGDVTETLGETIYGKTPEERVASLNAQQSANVYVMNTSWDTEDPVATWTKASAVAVPVLADPNNLFLLNVTLE